MTGYSKTEPPFSCIRLTCFFNDTTFEAYEVPLDWGTRGTGAPQSEPETSFSSSRKTIDWESQLVRTPTMRLHKEPQSIWSSWQRSTRLALDKSATTTSIRKFEGLPVSSRPMRSTSTSFLSRTPVI